MHRLLLAAALLLTTSALAGGAGWASIDNSDGIETFRKEVEGSNMMAFRGEGETDVHISLLASVLLDPSKGTEWVDMLVGSELVRRDGPNHILLYNHYDLSWPISDRDYVMDRVARFDPEAKVVTVTYSSVVDPLKPEQDCCVRATAHRTFWRFTTLPSGRTKVEVEVHTDPQGMLPAWVVNMVQKGWPKNSISGLTARSIKPDVVPHPQAVGW
jgi:hypothetical protein